MRQGASKKCKSLVTHAPPGCTICSSGAMGRQQHKHNPAQNEQQKKGLQIASHSRVSGVHHLQLRPHLVDLQHVAVGDAQLAVNHDLRIAKQEIIGMHEEGAAG